MISQRARILPPYTRRVDDTRHLVSKVVAVTALILFAMLMGFLIAIFGVRGWFIPAIPIVTLFGVALWMAPDIDPHFDRGIIRGYFAFMIISLIWPNYIALNIPGVPWISLDRLVMFMLLTITMLQIATSKRMRDEIADILNSQLVMKRLFFVWVLISIVMSAVAGFGNVSRDVNIQIMWHLPFILSAWIMAMPGMAEKFLKLMVIYALIVSAVVIPEVRLERPFWIDYVPYWLLAEDYYAGKMLDGATRFGVYRAKSVYSVSLAFAELIGMASPFVLFAIFHAKAWWRAALGLALFALLFSAAWLTQSRTAIAVFFVSLPAFLLLWAIRRFRVEAKTRDMIGPVILWAYPAFAAVLTAAVLFVPRIRVRVLGGSGTRFSDNARDVQWDMAIPKIIQNPLGYGSGTVSKHVPYTNLAGEFTIDSYPINLLINYGVPGFLAFAGFFMLAAYVGSRAYVMAESREELVAGAAAIGLMSFLVSRTILSMEGGVPLAFVFAGVVLGVHWRQQQRAPAVAPKAALPLRYPSPARQMGGLAPQN